MILVFPVERWWGTYPLFFCLFVVWLYVTYFVYKYFIVPKIYQGRKERLKALAVMGISLAVTFLFSCYRISTPYHDIFRQQRELYPYPLWGIRQNQQAVWLHYIVVVIFCFAVGMLTEAYRQRLARKEMEYERNKAELALYKAQINPHFLFNTLNTIYGLLITHSDKTEAAMERFINLIKYMYNNANREYIPVAEEVEYIDQYIGLQTLRLNDFADISFSHPEIPPEMSVPPMLLVTFIENAFKYGISCNEPCFVHIRLFRRNRSLVFEVDNSVFERNIPGSRKTGLENCRKRLSLLYPGRHRLETWMDGNTVFHVRLELQSI